MKRVILLFLAAGACRQPTAPATAVQRGMTERQVVEVNDNRVPDRVIERICGNETAAPFPCKIYVYDEIRRDGHYRPKISIVFEKAGDRWLVGQWL